MQYQMCACYIGHPIHNVVPACLIIRLLRSDTGISSTSDGTGPMEIPPLSKKFTFNGSPNDATELDLRSTYPRKGKPV